MAKAKSEKTPKPRKKKVSPCPKHMQWVNCYIMVKNGKQSLDFYEKAFGFKTKEVIKEKDGSIGHAELTYKDCLIMLSECCSPEVNTKNPTTLGGTTFNFYVYTEDVDTLFKQAVAAGATGLKEPQDTFWGDRWCMLKDPEGHIWAFATHISDEQKCDASGDMACSGDQKACT